MYKAVFSVECKDDMDLERWCARLAYICSGEEANDLYYEEVHLCPVMVACPFNAGFIGGKPCKEITADDWKVVFLKNKEVHHG